MAPVAVVSASCKVVAKSWTILCAASLGVTDGSGAVAGRWAVYFWAALRALISILDIPPFLGGFGVFSGGEDPSGWMTSAAPDRTFSNWLHSCAAPRARPRSRSPD